MSTVSRTWLKHKPTFVAKDNYLDALCTAIYLQSMTRWPIMHMHTLLTHALARQSVEKCGADERDRRVDPAYSRTPNASGMPTRNSNMNCFADGVFLKTELTF